MKSRMKNMKFDKRKTVFFVVMLAVAIVWSGCGSPFNWNTEKVPDTIASGRLRQEVYALVSSAENSSLDYPAQYAYIEDIGDGRGYTAGVIGFTSGTGDLLDVVREYVRQKPAHNPLETYIPALETVLWTDSHEGLGQAFEVAWKQAAKDREMIQAQEAIVDAQYMNPAVTYAKEDGLHPLGQYIYYDALVVHGPGEDGDSFGGIRKEALRRAQSPAQGGDEKQYLEAFLEARAEVMQKEEAHSDLSRIETQQKFLQEGNCDLELPLEWNMYGDSFVLTEEMLQEQLE